MTEPKSKPTPGNGADDQREERIHIRVSKSEKRKFERLAKHLHTDLSEITRQALHERADVEFSKAKA